MCIIPQPASRGETSKREARSEKQKQNRARYDAVQSTRNFDFLSWDFKLWHHPKWSSSTRRNTYLKRGRLKVKKSVANILTECPWVYFISIWFPREGQNNRFDGRLFCGAVDQFLHYFRFVYFISRDLSRRQHDYLTTNKTSCWNYAAKHCITEDNFNPF